MRLVTVDGIDPSDVEVAVGPGTYDKGAQYARKGAVLQMVWDEDEVALRGTVRGSGANLYAASAYFTTEAGAGLEFEFGQCSCPVGIDCKHTAALALAAVGASGPGRTTAPSTGSAGDLGHTRPDAWEQELGSLLDPGGGAPDGLSGTATLGIELSLATVRAPRQPWMTGGRATTPGPTLTARLVRTGKNGWVVGGLSWSGLGPLLHHREYRSAQVRVLQELYALHQAADPLAAYHYGHQVTTIDLAEFGSKQLWPVLDEAAALGIRIVHARNDRGATEPPALAELCLDVTRGGHEDRFTVAPVLRVEGAEADVVPVRFVGAEGHGVVYVSGTEARDRADPARWRPRLARLARPSPPAVQRMALELRRLEIPTTEHDRFRDEFYPRLRHQATVVSSDDSFSPPVISDPTLVLRATYGADHDLDLAWEWAYDVGDTAVRAPAGPTDDDAGYRDPAAERALLERLDAPLDRFGLHGAGQEQPSNPRTALGGLDTMRFTTEVLPLLADAPGVAVEVSGEPADYREAGESLRIGVATDGVAGETDWFDLGVSITVEGREVPFTQVFLALASDEPHLLLPDGAFFSLRKPELQALRSLIEEARAIQDAPDGPLRISRFQAGLWDELTELGVVERQATAWRQQVTGLLSLEAVPATEPPSTLSAELRPYQRDGFGWLAFLWQYGLGGILADDMGLGKTLQSLALICHAKQAEEAMSPFLVVAPTSVVGNWVTEAARFAPDLTVVSITDTLRRRGQSLHEIVAGADVVVTTYTLMRLDVESYADPNVVTWSGVIFDEAQSVKNHQSKAHQCARRVSAPFKVAITGTPMENNLMELWSLLAITAPGLFPSPTRFRDHFARPIEKQADAGRLAALRRRIRPLIKRRTKELVAADLPAKQEQVLEVDLGPKHRTIYQRHLQRERQKILGLIGDMNRNRFTILRSLTLLRQLSLHAGLVDDTHRDVGSSKIDALVEQLEDVVGGGHRALVFSQFTGFLALVRERLDAAGIAYCYLDGSTRHRASVVSRFTGGAAPVFLISLKAGGFGLNLTQADYCFVLDPWWNPATEAQAVDRAHRIGQTRTVMVYRLIARDTIEEKVMALKNRKAELFAGVMDDGDAFGSTLDAADIRALLE